MARWRTRSAENLNEQIDARPPIYVPIMAVVLGAGAALAAVVSGVSAVDAVVLGGGVSATSEMTLRRYTRKEVQTAPNEPPTEDQ